MPTLSTRDLRTKYQAHYISSFATPEEAYLWVCRVKDKSILCKFMSNGDADYCLSRHVYGADFITSVAKLYSRVFRHAGFTLNADGTRLNPWTLAEKLDDVDRLDSYSMLSQFDPTLDRISELIFPNYAEFRASGDWYQFATLLRQGWRATNAYDENRITDKAKQLLRTYMEAQVVTTRAQWITQQLKK